ncbi:MAG: 4-alpha-glucanotransferase [Bulleidia sp.]|nr:4-alpha-glucanotransferase [Bulleidia sp.]
MKRSSGILLPVFSLASPYGIGCFSKEAYEFIDFLKTAGQSYWQILPVGPTGFGDSPYASVSAFAGNPYFIDPVQLKEEGLLEDWEMDQKDWGSDQESVDYGAMYNNRYILLKTAFDRFVSNGMQEKEEYKAFLKDNASWLEDYALYMTIKKKHDNKSWLDWEPEYRGRSAKALTSVKEELKELYDFVLFQQYEFDRQWKKLHAYAKENGISIIGDIPFYVSMDSCDAWAYRNAFCFDKKGKPLYVAGTAPDAFSKEGQLWGNPVYDWKQLKKDHYGWWIDRIRHDSELFDTIRIDHFHGFAEYYAIPYGDKNGLNGKEEKGPGMDFFHELKKQLGDVSLIAEDLGNVTEDNKKLLVDSGIPGMKILEYAFTSWDSIYLPYKYEKNCVVYTGTHDNMPVRAWLETLNEGEINYLRRYLNSMDSDYGRLTWDLIREAYRSTADLCIIPLTDYLVKGNEARLNTPGTSGNNWKWRLPPYFLSQDLATSIHDLAATYGRIVKKEEN